jgi:hypothetical protein
MFRKNTNLGNNEGKNNEKIDEILHMMDSYGMPERRMETQSPHPLAFMNPDLPFREIMANKSVLFSIIDRDEYFAITKKKSK